MPGQLIAIAAGPTIFVLLTAAVFLYLHMSRRKEESRADTRDWTAGWFVLVCWSALKSLLLASKGFEGEEVQLLLVLVDLLLAGVYAFFIAGALEFVSSGISKTSRSLLYAGLVSVPLIHAFLGNLGDVKLIGEDYGLSPLLRAVVLAALAFWLGAIFLICARRFGTFGLLILAAAFVFRGFHHLYMGLSFPNEPFDNDMQNRIVAFFTILTALMMIIATLDRTRELLLQSESKFRQFFKSASDPIFLLDPQTGRIVDANAACEELYGYERGKLLAMGIGELSAPEGFTGGDLMRRLLTPQKPRERVDTIQRNALGQTFPVSITRSFIEVAGARYLLLHMRDVSELRQQERSLASRISQLTAIQRISQSLTRTLDPGELTTIIFDRLHAMVPMSFFAIDGLDRETGLLHNLITVHMQGGVMTRLEHPQGRGAGMREEDYNACITEREARFIRASRLEPVEGPAGSCEQILVLPMVASDQVIGLMFLGSDTENTVDGSQVDLLQNIASIAGIAMRNAQLYRDQRDQIRRQQFLAELGPAVSAVLDSSEIARIVGERLRLFFRAEDVEVWFVEDQSTQLVRAWPFGGMMTPLPLPGAAGGRNYDITMAAFSSDQPIIENDCRNSKLIPERWVRDRGLASCVAAPVVTGERHLGVIRVDDCRQTGRFTPADADFLMLVSQFTATAVEGARLYQTARASERRFAHLVEAAKVGIVILHDGRIEFANAYFQEMLDLINTPIQNVLFMDSVPQEFRETWLRAVSEAQEESKESTFESWLKRSDGRRLLAEVSISPVVYMNLTAVQIVVTDITDKRAALSQRQHDMRIRSIGTLTAGIGRDFHSLFSLMLAQISYLKLEGMPSETAERSLGIIEVSTWRALDYTRQLLAFAETSATGLSQLDLNGILLQSGQLFDSLDKEGLAKVAFELGGDLPRARGQDEQLRQAFLNLFIALARMAGVDNTLVVRSEAVKIETPEEASLEELEYGDYVLVRFLDKSGVFDNGGLIDMMNLNTEVSSRPSLGMSVFLSTLRGHQVTIDVTRDETSSQLLLYFPAETAIAPSTPLLVSSENGKSKHNGNETNFDSEETEIPSGSRAAT